ncbi:MAG: hypothetical protein JW734_04495 [Candidatus Omnitrophica bacterium]|nr:hypothetical protein [Candidatus Omnitrophota bacterium]
MKKVLLLFCIALLLGGCFSIVDDTGEHRRVKSFGITNDEVLDMLEEMDTTPDDEKKEYKLFEK